MAREPDERAPFRMRAGWALVRVLVEYLLSAFYLPSLPDGALRPRLPTPPDVSKGHDVAELHRRMMKGQRLSDAEYGAMRGAPWIGPPAEHTVRNHVLPGERALRPNGRGEAREPDPDEIARRERTRTQRVTGLFAVAGGLAALSLAAAVFDRGPSPPPLVLSHCPRIAPLGTPVLGTPVRLGDELGPPVVVAGGVVWAMTGRRDVLGAITGTGLAGVDVRTGRPVGRRLPGVDAAAYGRGVLWAARGERLLALDPRTGRMIGPPISLGSRVTRLVVGDGSVWALVDEGVRRVDMATRQVGPFLETDVIGETLAAGEGAVWLVDNEDDELRRFDPRTGAIRTISADAFSTDDVAVRAGSVWMLGSGRVVRIDPRTLAQSPPIGVGGSAQAFAVAGDAILIETDKGGIFRIDTRCDRAVGPLVSVGAGNVGLLAYGDGTAAVAGSNGVLTPIRLAG